ncbi:MAG TPA: carboxylesterase family protein [Ohtaekwangia sp.]|nr:carboxylesterase family protein [Ohtaekwangia sp.]
MRQLQLLLLCSMTLAMPCHGQLKIVRTEAGLISGKQAGSVSVFKGVPFAAPPVGNLRWKAPQPVKSWEGIRACTTFAASPMQSKPVPFKMWTAEFIAPPDPLSEDCLYVNVWTAARTAKDKRPVFVWIYGGGFVSGSAACAIYDGRAMAEKGIVFVSINYRVGVFGFLAHPELSGSSGTNTSGNYGLLDQIAALRWVQKNIAAFGGDPRRVTIAGQSAGSMSVTALIASPLTEGLFHGAIAQSGGILGNSPIKTLQQAEDIGQTFMKQANAATVEALRSKTAAQIQKISQGLPYGSFAPVRDGYVVPMDIIQHFKNGLHQDVPTITGWVAGDAALRSTPDISIAEFRDDAGKKYPGKRDEFLTLFPAGSISEVKRAQVKLALLQFAALPGYRLASTNKSKTYLYQFTFVPSPKPGFPDYGAFHTAEVPYALHTLQQWERPWQSRDREMEDRMSGYWANFITTGNPNGKGLPLWKSYDLEGGNILELGDEIVLQPGLLQKELEFLANAAY